METYIANAVARVIFKQYYVIKKCTEAKEVLPGNCRHAVYVESGCCGSANIKNCITFYNVSSIFNSGCATG